MNDNGYDMLAHITSTGTGARNVVQPNGSPWPACGACYNAVESCECADYAPGTRRVANSDDAGWSVPPVPSWGEWELW